MTPEKEPIIQKIEVVPDETEEEKRLKYKKATVGQSKFYEQEIAKIRSSIEEARHKGLGTKDLEKRLEDLEKLEEKTKEELS